MNELKSNGSMEKDKGDGNFNPNLHPSAEAGYRHVVSHHQSFLNDQRNQKMYINLYGVVSRFAIIKDFIYQDG